jgi:hypothetical protein
MNARNWAMACVLAAVVALAMSSMASAQTAVVVVPGVRPAYAYPAYPAYPVPYPVTKHAYRRAVRNGAVGVAPAVVAPVVVDRFGHPFYGPTSQAKIGYAARPAYQAPAYQAPSFGQSTEPTLAPTPIEPTAPQGPSAVDNGIQTTVPELVPAPAGVSVGH